MLIVRAHPELLRAQRLPEELIAEKAIWKERYRSNQRETDEHSLCYSADMTVLSQEHSRTILHCSVEPVLTPHLKEERQGSVPNVVFPTGIDRRDNLGQPDRCRTP